MAGKLAVQNTTRNAEFRSKTILGVLSEESIDPLPAAKPTTNVKSEYPPNICAQLVVSLLRKDQSLRGECKIMDVGCSKGEVAIALRQQGFVKIFGADYRKTVLEEVER